MCAWLSDGSPDDVVSFVMQLRRQELDMLPVMGDGGAGLATSSPSRATKESSGGQDTAAEVALILRTESHLTARDAAERLATELKKEICLRTNAAPPDIPKYSKESFHTYVGKLLKLTSPQMLLHLAHRIRDSVIGRPSSAWPLRSAQR